MLIQDDDEQSAMVASWYHGCYEARSYLCSEAWKLLLVGYGLSQVNAEALPVLYHPDTVLYQDNGCASSARRTVQAGNPDCFGDIVLGREQRRT